MTARFILLTLLFVLGAAPTAGAEKFGAPLPAREDSGLTRVEHFLKNEEWSAALTEIDYVLKRHPRNADAYTYKGYAYINLGDMDEARKDFKKAIELNPTHLGANQYLGEIFVHQGQVSRAVEQLQVIRMICGKTDCAEQRALQSAIDKARDHGNEE